MCRHDKGVKPKKKSWRPVCGRARGGLYVQPGSIPKSCQSRPDQDQGTGMRVSRDIVPGTYACLCWTECLGNLTQVK